MCSSDGFARVRFLRYPWVMAKNRITEIRLARGMSVRDLAKAAGFSGPYVSQMAAGVRNISLGNLERLATALQCQPEDLLGTRSATNTDILDIWAAIPPERRDLARTVLESFMKSPATTKDDTDSVHLGTQTKRRKHNPR